MQQGLQESRSPVVPSTSFPTSLTTSNANTKPENWVICIQFNYFGCKWPLQISALTKKKENCTSLPATQFTELDSGKLGGKHSKRLRRRPMHFIHQGRQVKCEGALGWVGSRSRGGLQEAPGHGRIRWSWGGVAIRVDAHWSSHRMVKLAVYAELADAITRVEFAELFPLKISK
jgi:hypothetical protein